MLPQPAINGSVVIGITGGVATGKSAFCESLRQLLRGTFFDADRAAHDLSHNDPNVRETIAREFGAGIYSAAGELNRARLRAIVFEDKEKKLALEGILHPRIRQQWAEQAANSRKFGELFLADIPLLYETGGETLCDRVVVVACSARTQLERLTARTRLDATLARQMIEAQMPLTEKIRRADHLVWNNDGRSSLEAQAAILARFWQQ
jgi:dephospho-CoA kinase